MARGRLAINLEDGSTSEVDLNMMVRAGRAVHKPH
jgi:hypothetical protein